MGYWLTSHCLWAVLDNRQDRLAPNICNFKSKHAVVGTCDHTIREAQIQRFIALLCPMRTLRLNFSCLHPAMSALTSRSFLPLLSLLLVQLTKNLLKLRLKFQHPHPIWAVQLPSTSHCPTLSMWTNTKLNKLLSWQNSQHAGGEKADGLKASTVWKTVRTLKDKKKKKSQNTNLKLWGSNWEVFWNTKNIP